MHRRTAGVASLSLNLPDIPLSNEGAVRAAYRRAHLRVPFEVAIRHPALSICLHCCAEAHARRKR